MQLARVRVGAIRRGVTLAGMPVQHGVQVWSDLRCAVAKTSMHHEESDGRREYGTALSSDCPHAVHTMHTAQASVPEIHAHSALSCGLTRKTGTHACVE